jgi:sulfur-carrier protein
MGAGGQNRRRRKISIMEISVLFFGVLAEVAGTHRKHYRSIKSFGDLKHRVEDDFPEIVHYNFRIAVNNKIVNEEPLLSQGDEIAYLPPFAGG